LLIRFGGGLLIFVVGLLLAKIARSLVHRVVRTLRISQLIESTPLQLGLESSELGPKIESVLATIAYVIVLLLVVHAAATQMKLEAIVYIATQFLNYIPKILSSLLILIFGLLLAGIVETLVKSAIRNLSSVNARLIAKSMSYFVVTIAILSALSELGIATFFINVLFVGITLAGCLAVGLALGLGGKDVVSQWLMDWYHRNRVTKTSKKKDAE